VSGRLGNAAQNALMLLLFNNTAWANVGNTAGLQPSGAAGSLFVALHTADPGAAGTQATSEAAYSGYARQAVARSSGGWTVSGSSPTGATNTAAVTFPASLSGPETEANFSVGLQASGATQYMFTGPLTSSLVVNSGITPSFAISACTCTMD
jgi:hypothetical protein